MKLVEPYVNLLHATPKMVEVIEQAGRLCYKSERKEGDTSERFVNRIMKLGHESVIEHATVGVIIGTDRGVTHELVRHRIASYSQTSTRYCNYAKDSFGGELSFVVPSGLKNAEMFKAWRVSCEVAEDTYLDLICKGATPQIARSVLPNSLFTEIAVTMNLRSWRHFISLRTSPKAHPDMRVVAALIDDLMRKICPCIFDPHWELQDFDESRNLH